MVNADEQDVKEAILLARKCPVSSTAFCVGCIIKVDGKVLATGYSREYKGNTHAEEVALMKWLSIDEATDDNMNDSRLDNALERCCLPKSTQVVTVISTMEPCAVRLSGKATCASRIGTLYKALARTSPRAKLRVVVGGSEPDDLVKEAEGTGVRSLRAVGIEVVAIQDRAIIESCLEIGRRDQPKRTDTREEYKILDLDNIKAMTDAAMAYSRALAESWLPQVESGSKSENSSSTQLTGRPPGLGLGAVMTKGYQSRNHSALSRIDPKKAKRKEDDRSGTLPTRQGVASLDSDDESRATAIGAVTSKRYKRGK